MTYQPFPNLLHSIVQAKIYLSVQYKHMIPSGMNSVGSPLAPKNIVQRTIKICGEMRKHYRIPQYEGTNISSNKTQTRKHDINKCESKKSVKNGLLLQWAMSPYGIKNLGRNYSRRRNSFKIPFPARDRLTFPRGLDKFPPELARLEYFIK